MGKTCTLFNKSYFVNIDGVRQAGKTTSNSVGGVWMVAGGGGGGLIGLEMTGYVGKQN